MSIRRSRNSLEVSGQGGPSNGKALMSIEFEDFRKRHSRQNKDIIIENALRRTTIKNLQEEIAKLQVDLLEVKRENCALQAQVKRMRNAERSMHDSQTTSALDQILAAVPALRQLRDGLEYIRSSPTSVSSPAPFSFKAMENPVATRPAAVGAGKVLLTTLMEASEQGSAAETSSLHIESGLESNGKSRSSGIKAHVATRSSPRRASNPIVPPNPEIICDISPESDAPLPLSGSRPFPRSPSLEKKQKSRRQSGLLPLPRRSLSPTDQWTDDPPEKENASPSHLSVTSRRKPKKDSVVSQVAVKEIASALRQARVGADGGQPDPQDDITSKSALDSRAVRSRRHISPQLSEPTSKPSTPPRESSVSEAENVMDTVRGRRVRRSVNYKEPSLTKKMRKPDGLTVEDTLRGRLSMDTSALPDTTSIDLTSGQFGFTQRSVAGPSTMAMRRKSVLPKASTYNPPSSSTPDEDEEDDVDDSLYIDSGQVDRDSSPSRPKVAEVHEAVETPPPVPPVQEPDTATLKPVAVKLPTRVSPRKKTTAKFQASSPRRKTTLNPVEPVKPISRPRVTSHRGALMESSSDNIHVRSVKAEEKRLASRTAKASGRRMTSVL